MSLARDTLLAASWLALATPCAPAQGRFVPWSRHAESLNLGMLEAADIDADGDLDVISVNSRYVGVHVNDGTGRFVDETASRAPLLPVGARWRPVVADLDGDRDLDVATQAGILINDGRGYFKDETTARYPRRIDTWLSYHPLAMDADNDGDIDLLFLQGATAPTLSIPHLWINDGRGYFRDETPTRLRSKLYSVVIAGDVDGDGDLDLISGSGDARIAFVLLKNNGRGTFDLAWSEPAPDTGDTWTFALIDVDGDRDLDLYVARWPDRFYRNDGKGAWQQDTSVIVAGPDQYSGLLLVGDFTSDGYPDVLKTHSPVHYGSSLLVHDGNGRLWAQPGAVLWRDHWDVAAGDFDGDGDLDMATAVLPPIFPPTAPKGLAIDMNLDRHVHAPAPPRLGQPWDVDLWSLRAPAVFLPFIAAGQAATPLPLPGLGTLRLDPATMVALGSWAITGTNTKTTMRLAIPQDAALLGLPLAIQAGFARDNRVRLSNVLTHKIQ